MRTKTLGRTEPLQAANPNLERLAAMFACPSLTLVDVPLDLSHVSVGQSVSPTLACLAAQPSCLQLVLLRPMDKLLGMTVLKFDSEVTKPQTFEDQAPDVELSAEELELSKRLVAISTAKRFDYSTYRDVFTGKLTQLIEAKVAGEEIAAPPAQEPLHIINLMDALRASVANAEHEQPTKDKPPKKLAASKGKESRSRRKKSS
jgi:DNA end-binding protein Ku